jgi:hypothetical protein
VHDLYAIPTRDLFVGEVRSAAMWFCRLNVRILQLIRERPRPTATQQRRLLSGDPGFAPASTSVSSGHSVRIFDNFLRFEIGQARALTEILPKVRR